MTLTLFLAISATAIASEYTFESWSNSGNRCVLQFSSVPDVNWDGKSKLPLSIEDVREIFNDWTKRALASNEQAHVTGYDLSSVVADGIAQNYWVFKIRYTVFSNNEPSETFNRKVAIDLSGRVIEAKCGI
ncbi:hypothetical protein GCM10011357_17720 [Lacimicrobium alkaliphilum]|uniref:Uncharacterized protein n=2 Tax=Lacimicrobium alkaliphilum TaxID=1526571 RepID=A0ABQ1R9C5_9ALTE|nr:hypothetical protein GCM10011357_17720 [Lacimicrobium alkaliphilum]